MFTPVMARGLKNSLLFRGAFFEGEESRGGKNEGLAGFTAPANQDWNLC